VRVKKGCQKIKDKFLPFGEGEVASFGLARALKTIQHSMSE